MDNLAHSLVGVLLARAGLREYTPHGTAICVVAANIPDIDIVVGIDSITYLNYHRHLTHSLFVIPLMAALALALVAGIARLRRGAAVKFGPAFAIALVSAYSHPLLDFMNAYGIRLWLPFSERWSSWDALFVIDPVVWVLPALAVLLPLRGGRARGRRHFGKRPAQAVLLLLVAYCGLNRHWHNTIVESLPAGQIEGRPILRKAAFPAPFSPTNWIGLLETKEAFYTFEADPLDLADLGRPTKLTKHRGPAAEAAWSSELGRDYYRFAQYGFAQVGEQADGYHVRLGDVRFRRGDQTALSCVVELDESLNVVSSYFDF